MSIAGFREYLDTYLDAIAEIRYSDLDELQPPPFASVAYGGAGTAYALWRLGKTRAARTWIRAALADRRRAAFDGKPPLPPIRPGSYLFGRLGVQWVQAGIETGEARRQATQRFVAGARAASRVAELANGAGGALVGAMLLARRGNRAPALADLATSLAVSLERRARRRPGAAWQPADSMQFAHGWGGILYAILAYKQWRDDDVPAWLVEALRALASSPAPAAVPHLESSWCNGAAGATLLWAKAFECTRERAFLDAARASAQRAVERSTGMQILCCGDAGVAYALFALHRSDPATGWEARAREIAARAVSQHAMKWPLGLFNGHPGLVCLALDCAADEHRGFPGLEY